MTSGVSPVQQEINMRERSRRAAQRKLESTPEYKAMAKKLFKEKCEKIASAKTEVVSVEFFDPPKKLPKLRAWCTQGKLWIINHGYKVAFEIKHEDRKDGQKIVNDILQFLNTAE